MSKHKLARLSANSSSSHSGHQVLAAALEVHCLAHIALPFCVDCISAGYLHTETVPW